MVKQVSAEEIVSMAKQCGFLDCGIIPVSDMAGYADMLDRRFARFPDQAAYGQKYYDYAYPQRRYPWAQSVIIGVRHYGKYAIPPSLEGVVGKFCLTETDNPESNEYKQTARFNAYLKTQFAQVATDPLKGIIAYRWAALKAGLGMIRKNNFLYTEKGSWVRMEAWLIDQELVHRVQKTLPPCPERCTLCVQACPTHALSEPYMTRRTHCIEYLTAKVTSENDFTQNPLADQTNAWLYGCDACQDVCPMNRQKWEGTETFPGLDAFVQDITPERLLSMDYDYLRDVIQPKFGHIGKEECWKWKVNALNYMRTHYNQSYDAFFQRALTDQEAPVREMAKWCLQKLNLPAAE